MAEVFGIDLGTTNSVIARFSEKEGAIVIPVDNGKTMPSIVARNAGQWLAGKAARQHLMLNPSEGVSSIKRKMGLPNYRVQFGNEEYSPTQISAQILTHLKVGAEEALGCEVRDVVITVPAYFKEPERQATIEAGRLAGLNVLRIINEPTAAALVQTGDPSDEGDAVETLLVYDLGGGTFDVSIVRSSARMKEVIASSGDSHLGGDDFDSLIVEHLVAHIRENEGTDPTNDVRSMAFLRFLAEEIKISLSSSVQFSVDVIVPFENRSFQLKMIIRREEFEELIEDLIESTIEKTKALIEETKLSNEEIHKLLLVGGSTRIPLVVERLKSEFNLNPCRRIDPDLSVALGAALQAGVSVGKEYRSVVVDVAPHSLGVAAMGPLDLDLPADGEMPRTFVPLIDRNTPLPARFSETFYKLSPGQEGVIIHVLQGESPLTYENTLLGEFKAKVRDFSDTRVVVTFEYTVDGTVIIEVGTGKDLKSITRHSLSVAGSAQTAVQFVEMVNDVQENSNGASNFLSRKVRSKLKETEDEKISDIVCRYEGLLGEQSEELDELEDMLHDWLEAVG